MKKIEWIKIGEEIDSYHETIVDYELSDNRRVALRYNDVKEGFCYFKIAEDGRSLLELEDVEDGDEIYNICEKIEKEIRKEMIKNEIS